eukprot:335559-Rhodomonas_salina.1
MSLSQRFTTRRHRPLLPALRGRLRLTSRRWLTGGCCRGLPTEGCDGRKCARASHDKDSTNGFFVARFEVGPAKGGAGKTKDKVDSEGAKKRAREEGGEERAEKKSKKEKGGAEKRGEESVKSVKALKGASGSAEKGGGGGGGVKAKFEGSQKPGKKYEYGGEK